MNFIQLGRGIAVFTVGFCVFGSFSMAQVNRLMSLRTSPQICQNTLAPNRSLQTLHFENEGNLITLDFNSAIGRPTNLIFVYDNLGLDAESLSRERTTVKASNFELKQVERLGLLGERRIYVGDSTYMSEGKAQITLELDASGNIRWLAIRYAPKPAHFWNAPEWRTLVNTSGNQVAQSRIQFDWSGSRELPKALSDDLVFLLDSFSAGAADTGSPSGENVRDVLQLSTYGSTINEAISPAQFVEAVRYLAYVEQSEWQEYSRRADSPVFEFPVTRRFLAWALPHLGW